MANKNCFYPSTVFACQTSEDDRFIKCDFKWCSIHGEKARDGPVVEWILNTHRNVNSLESHVGQQIYNFMQDDSISQSNCPKQLCEGNKHLLENWPDGLSFSKILVVFNLRDPQALLGLWVDSFLKAARACDGIEDTSFCSITFSFASRMELLESVSQLAILVKKCPKAEVAVILSCHSSSQGQVFSCTPSSTSKNANFEEFCSLHDFVMTCENILGSILSVVHISSCFTLKMDKSHKDWPVCYSWYKNNLNCLLSGSTREVYETGSQTADLYLVLSTFCNKNTTGFSVQQSFSKAINRATTRDWPDLANEMGLTIFDAEKADEAVKVPEEDDTVTPPAVVLSPLHVILVMTSMKSDIEQSTDALCEALFLNMQLRKSTDINAHFTKLKITLCSTGDIGDTLAEKLCEGLMELNLNPAQELFFFFFGEAACVYSVTIVKRINLMLRENKWTVYGLHFQNMSHILWSRLMAHAKDDEGSPFPMTGVLNRCAPAWSKFPLLLYLVHLAVGENGTITLRRTTPGSQQRKLPSKWSLADVYLEASYVLSGVTMDCDLKLIAPDYAGINRERPVADIAYTSCTVEEPSFKKFKSEVDECFLRKIASSTSCEIEEASATTSCETEEVSGTTTCETEEVSATTSCETEEVSGTTSCETEEVSGTTSCETEEVSATTSCDVTAIQEGRSECANNDDGIEIDERSPENRQVIETDERSSGICRDEEINVDQSSSCLPPLMANVDDVLVTHFILDLNVCFDEKVISGSIILFIKPAKENLTKNAFQMCLDSTMLDFEAAEEIALPDDFEIHFHDTKCCCNKEPCQTSTQCSATNSFSECQHCTYLHTIRESIRGSILLKMKKLSYSVHGWCIRLWKDDDHSKDWPKCLRIWYRTKPEGQSIFWAKDQDGNDSVFSPGAYINNRSLMPCQEPPIAMSTWQAYLHVRSGSNVLMSGDRVKCKESILGNQSGEQGLFCYEMSVAMPSSTLALLFGNYHESVEKYSVSCGTSQKKVSVRAYAAKSLLNQFTAEFLHLASLYIVAASNLLGEYPFSRLDLVLMPRCFACLGLESPNLAFLSQSLLCGDHSMSIRVAHEICHAWFGLLVGVSDWTEEWLSEGFATYLEERIQYQVEKLSPEEERERHELCKAVKYRVLKEELKEADDNMKSLRPRLLSSGYMSAAEAIRKSISVVGDTPGSPDKPSTEMVHIPSRKWTQIHYLKGYFLLDHLAILVGIEEFDRFLFKYVQRFRERLVTSEMFFDMFANEYGLSDDKKEQLIKEWLVEKRLPKYLQDPLADCNGKLIKEIHEKFVWWKKRDGSNKRCKTMKLKKKKIPSDISLNLRLNANQLILLLEKLLDRDCFARQTLTELQTVYSFQNCNAEIRHRWCELVIKEKYTKGYDQVERFLLEDQGMGVYLFGELIITEDSAQKRLVHAGFNQIKDEMDRCTFQTVYDMLNDKVTYCLHRSVEVGSTEVSCPQTYFVT
eukprot:gene7134-7939_t